MAKQSNALENPRDARALFAVKRQRSHALMEGLLLLSAFGILCVLFSFFTLELRSLSQDVFSGDTTSSTTSQQPSGTPPLVESRVIGSQLSLVEVNDSGDLLRTLYSSDLSDDIADFTLFAIPQTGYQQLIYVRPILDGNLPNLTVYPLHVEQGTLKAATLNIPSDAHILSSDQTLVGVLFQATLTLYALEDGAIVAQGEVPSDWTALSREGLVTLSLSENSCLSLTSALAPDDIVPFPSLCP